MSPHRQIQVLPDAAALARATAIVVVDAAQRAVADHGRFHVVLSGGSTPKALYSLLADDPELRAQVPWDGTFFFFGDERCVPPDHPDSNYRTANEALFMKVGIAPDHIFRMSGEKQAAAAADEYEQALRSHFALRGPELPRFDLVLLGMGPDGHTASLFPGTSALEERSRLVTANWVEKLHAHRVTMTAPALNHAAMVVFLVHGHDKSTALKAVLDGPHEPSNYPAQLIQPASGKLLWLVDESAAALLDERQRLRRAAT